MANEAGAAISETKTALRKEMRKKRDSLSAEIAAELSQKTCEKVSKIPEFEKAKTVALYIPKGSEADVKRLIIKAMVDKEILVPVTNDEIKLVQFTSFDDLKPAKFGILEPETKIKPNREPDIVIVPGLAFDSDLHRLGYGKGYYDRLFSRLNTFKIGICFDFQIIEKIPKHEHDVRLDCVVSEKRILRWKNE